MPGIRPGRSPLEAKLDSSNEHGEVYTPVTPSQETEWRAQIAGATGSFSRRILWLYQSVCQGG